jgi:hypothetical protein
MRNFTLTIPDATEHETFLSIIVKNQLKTPKIKPSAKPFPPITPASSTHLFHFAPRKPAR